jgi:hypothetical protein
MRLPVPTPGVDSPLRAAASSDGDRGIGPVLAAAVQATIAAGEAAVRALVRRTPAMVVALGAPAQTLRDALDETARARPTTQAQALVYELLDAHADTADLAADLRDEPRWAAHLDYLRALQRTGRETLAQMEEEDRT